MRLVENQMKFIFRLCIKVRDSLPYTFSAAQHIQCDISGYQSSAYKEYHLDNIGQRHRLQSAINGIDSGKSRQSDNAPNHRDTHHLFDRQCTEVKDGSQVDKDENSQPENSHDSLDPFIEAFLQKLGHGKYLLFEEYRNKVFGNDNQSQRRNPFVSSHCQPDCITGTGHTDKLLRRNIRSNNRSTDCPPGQSAPRQEIIAGIPFFSFFLPGDKQADKQDQGTVGDKNDQVYSIHGINI